MKVSVIAGDCSDGGDSFLADEGQEDREGGTKDEGEGLKRAICAVGVARESDGPADEWE